MSTLRRFIRQASIASGPFAAVLIPVVLAASVRAEKPIRSGDLVMPREHCEISLHGKSLPLREIGIPMRAGAVKESQVFIEAGGWTAIDSVIHIDDAESYCDA